MKRKIYVEFKHGMRIRLEGVRIYRKKEEVRIGNGVSYSIGETLLISIPKFNLIVFKGEQGYILKSPKLWRKPAPVKVSIH